VESSEAHPEMVGAKVLNIEKYWILLGGKNSLILRMMNGGKLFQIIFSFEAKSF
jgi:hypothetical protein